MVKAVERVGTVHNRRKKLKAMAEFINTKRRQTTTGTECLVRIRTLPRTHLPAILDLIKTARQQGNAHARLSNCLAVDVYHIEKAASISAGQRSLLEIAHNPFSQSRKAIRGHTLDLFYHFTPNRALYTVFPWPDEDCADVLSGAIWIVSYLNWGKVERTLKKRDLVVGDLDRARLSQFMLRPTGEQKLRTFDVGLSIGRPNSAPCKVSFVDLARISYEFLDEDAFADTIEEVLEIGIPPGELYFTAFENEALIWD